MMYTKQKVTIGNSFCVGIAHAINLLGAHSRGLEYELITRTIV